MAQQKLKQQSHVCPKCQQEEDVKKYRQQILNATAPKASRSMKIMITTSMGRRVKLSMEFDGNEHTVYDVKKAYCDEYGMGSNSDKITLFHRAKRLKPDYATLAALGITSRMVVLSSTFKCIGGGLAGVAYDKYSEKLIVGYDQYGGDTFEIPAFHVSCRSDKYTGEDMTGIVFYQYDNKVDWRLNNIHCKSGYIVLKLTKNIDHIKGEPGMVHGACYKWMFNQSIDSKVIGGGFAYYKGQWKFRSYTFNTGTKYHDNKKGMHPMEQECIEAAIENWKRGIQNTYIKHIARKYKGSCSSHGWY